MAEWRTMQSKSFSDLKLLETFEERLDFLLQGGAIGQETFGYDRYLNQMLYHSDEWRKVRRDVIVRDNACDLGCPGHDIPDGKSVYVHHINPITKEDIINRDPKVLDPNNLICMSLDTHNLVHFGTKDDPIKQLQKQIPERSPNDQVPWRH